MSRPMVMRRAALGSWTAVGERWLSEEQGTASDVDLGETVVLQMIAVIPVTDALVVLRSPPTTQVRTSKFGDDAIAAGCGD